MFGTNDVLNPLQLLLCWKMILFMILTDSACSGIQDNRQGERQGEGKEGN